MKTFKLTPLALAIAFGTTQAQTNENQSPDKDGPHLERIEITAQRKVESIQDAGLPIDAIGKDELARNGISDVLGVSKASPALTVVSGGGSNTVYFVRGVGNFAVNAYTDPALAFNIDGVYIGRPTATTASFLDLERVEVLKGPQGTLYGRNATAGAINIIPAKPVLGENSTELTLGFGNFGTIEAGGTFNVDVSDNWAARLAVGRLKNDGFNDDGTAQTDDTALRAQLYGELSDKLNVRLAVDYSTTEGTGNAPTYLGSYGFPFGGATDNPNNIPGYNFNPAPAEVSRPWSGPYTDASREFYASLTTTPAFTSTEPQEDAGVDNSYFGITGEINWDLGFGQLVVIPAYREADLDVLFVNPGFRAAINKEEHEQFSLETRLSTTTGDVDWIFGAFYFDEEVSGNLSFNQQSLQSTQVIDASDSESKALFARASYNLSEDLRLVGGVRYSDDKKTIDGVANVFLNLCIRDLEVFPGGPEIPNCEGAPVIPVGATVEETLAQLDPADLPAGPPQIGQGPVPFGQIPLFPGAPDTLRANLLFINPTVVQRTRDESEVTYRLAVEYDVKEDSLLYASYETGYRSGGFGLTTGREEYEPEFLDAFTLGSKNLFMDGRMKFNAELFYWDYQDQQASHLGLDVNGNSALVTENIGESTIKGGEFDLWFAATEDTTIRATAQYLRNEIEEYGYEQLTPDVEVRVVSGCDQTLLREADNGGVWLVDCSGQEGRNSPRWTFNLGVDHLFQVGELYGRLSLDARYRDERWIGFDYLPVQRADAVTTFDATVTLESNDGTWSVMAYARNFTDEDVQAITQTLGGIGNTISTVYEPPRTLGVRFSYNFH